MWGRERFRIERPPLKETLQSNTTVAICGLGQVGGGLCLPEISLVLEMKNIYGIGRDYQRPWLAKRFPEMPFYTEIERAISRNPQILILAIPNPVEKALEEIAEAISKPSVKSPIIVLPQNGVAAVPMAKEVFKGMPVDIVRASLLTAIEGDPEMGKFNYDREKLKIALAQVSGRGIDEIADLFQRTGFRVEVCLDYQSMEWTKLFLNTIGITGTITNLPPRATFEDEVLFILELQGIRDRVRLLKAAGIPLINFLRLRVPAKLLSQILVRFPESSLVRLRNQIAILIAGERCDFPPSSARRIAQEKRTEIPYYLGPFIRLGRSPVDEAIWAIVERHESGECNLRMMSLEERRKVLLREVSHRQKLFS